jgi:hypothetical protein
MGVDRSSFLGVKCGNPQLCEVEVAYAYEQSDFSYQQEQELKTDDRRLITNNQFLLLQESRP